MKFNFSEKWLRWAAKIEDGFHSICCGVPSNLSHYLDLQDELFEIRKKHHGNESDEEDNHLEKMDVAWKKLSTYEINQLRKKTND